MGVVVRRLIGARAAVAPTLPMMVKSVPLGFENLHYLHHDLPGDNTHRVGDTRHATTSRATVEA